MAMTMGTSGNGSPVTVTLIGVAIMASITAQGIGIDRDKYHAGIMAPIGVRALSLVDKRGFKSQC